MTSCYILSHVFHTLIIIYAREEAYVNSYLIIKHKLKFTLFIRKVWLFFTIYTIICIAEWTCTHGFVFSLEERPSMIQ